MAWRDFGTRSLRGADRSGGTGRAATPAPAGGAGTWGPGGTDIDKNVPQWDGRAASLENFEEEIELYASSCEDRQLALL